MSNVVPFPDIRSVGEHHTSMLDEVRVQAYATRHAKEPERIIEMSYRLRLAAKTAELLHTLIEDIKGELES